MDRLLIILKKKKNGPRALSAPALGFNTILFKHVYWYKQQISGERLQDHWSSGCKYVQDPPSPPPPLKNIPENIALILVKC